MARNYVQTTAWHRPALVIFWLLQIILISVFLGHDSWTYVQARDVYTAQSTSTSRYSARYPYLLDQLRRAYIISAALSAISLVLIVVEIILFLAHRLLAPVFFLSALVKLGIWTYVAVQSVRSIVTIAITFSTSASDIYGWFVPPILQFIVAVAVFIYAIVMIFKFRSGKKGTGAARYSYDHPEMGAAVPSAYNNNAAPVDTAYGGHYKPSGPQYR